MCTNSSPSLISADEAPFHHACQPRTCREKTLAVRNCRSNRLPNSVAGERSQHGLRGDDASSGLTYTTSPDPPCASTICAGHDWLVLPNAATPDSSRCYSPTSEPTLEKAVAMELLPIVTLSSRDDLKLKGYNQAAVRDLDLTAGNSPFRAAAWLRRPGPRHSEDPLEDGEALDVLEGLARESLRCTWGQGVLLHFWSNAAPASAEVLVSHASRTGTIEIVFLRPLDMPSLASPDPLESHVPESRFSSRVPPPPLSVDRSAGSAPSGAQTTAVPKGVPQHVLNGDAKSETSRSASWGSGQSTSASTRRTSRPAVGAERRNLPLSPEFTSMLAHATGRVTDPNSFSPETRQTSPIDGRPPPWARLAQRDEDTARLEEKLPLSVGVLVGRRESFDRGIEALSDGTDRSAGRPLPFRVPTQDERDAHDLRRADSMDTSATPPLTDTPDIEMASSSKPPSPPPVPPTAARRQALSFGQLADMIETMPVVSFSPVSMPPWPVADSRCPDLLHGRSQRPSRLAEPGVVPLYGCRSRLQHDVRGLDV